MDFGEEHSEERTSRFSVSEELDRESVQSIHVSQQTSSMVHSAVPGAGGFRVGASLSRNASAPRAPAAATHPVVRLMPAVAVTEIRKLTTSDFCKIVDWLEVTENFATLHGTESRLAIGMKHPSKKTTFQHMLITLHSNGFSSSVKTRENLKKRFTRYQSKYREAVMIKNDSGDGLSIGELRCGITMTDKLDKICPHFERMDALYGEKHNVDPDVLAAPGIPGIPPVYYEGLSDGDDLEDPAGDSPVEENGMDNVDYNDWNDNCEPDSQAEFTEQFTANTGTPWNVEEPSSAQPVQVPPGFTLSPRRASASTPSPTPAFTEAPNVAAATVPSSTATRRVPTKRPLSTSSQATSKSGSVADLYLEKMAGKGLYRQQMIETKDKWATLELADRREARQASADDAREARKAMARAEAQDAAKQRKHEHMKVDIEHQHALSLFHAQQTTSIMNVLFQSSRS